MGDWQLHYSISILLPSSPLSSSKLLIIGSVVEDFFCTPMITQIWILCFQKYQIRILITIFSPHLDNLPGDCNHLQRLSCRYWYFEHDWDCGGCWQYICWTHSELGRGTSWWAVLKGFHALQHLCGAHSVVHPSNYHSQEFLLLRSFNKENVHLFTLWNELS